MSDIKKALFGAAEAESVENAVAGGGSSGGGGGKTVIGATLDGTTLTFNKTAREILSAMKTGVATFIYSSGDTELVADFTMANVTSQGTVNFTVSDLAPSASTLDDFPTVNT